MAGGNLSVDACRSIYFCGTFLLIICRQVTPLACRQLMPSSVSQVKIPVNMTDDRLERIEKGY